MSATHVRNRPPKVDDKHAELQAWARLVGIEKSFGETVALANVSLDFHAGEVHAILGENGAGKTTLVRILSGILHPDAGHLEINGSPIFLSGRKDGAVHGIGIVQQQDGLIGELTGTDNYLIDHPKSSLWLDRSQARNELVQAAQMLGLTVNPDALVSELTVGERQRLEILIALMIGADLIIFDEPTAALVDERSTRIDTPDTPSRRAGPQRGLHHAQTRRSDGDCRSGDRAAARTGGRPL